MIILYRDNVISNHTPYTRFDHDLKKEKLQVTVHLWYHHFHFLSPVLLFQKHVQKAWNQYY